MPAILDPELVRQLAAPAGDGLVEAVIRLRPEEGTIAPAPDETERLTRELVTRVQEASGEHEDAFNVFRYLGSFAISATVPFLKTLLAQPEVAGALANKQPGPALIPPLDKRPARIEEVGRETGKRSVKPAPKRAPRAKTRRAPR